MSLLSWRRSADTYAVLGPRLTTADEVANPNPLDLVLQVNGEVRQQANTREQVYNVDKPISWASEKYPLDPRGITLTGPNDRGHRVSPRFGDRRLVRSEESDDPRRFPRRRSSCSASGFRESASRPLRCGARSTARPPPAILTSAEEVTRVPLAFNEPPTVVKRPWPAEHP